MNDKELEKIKDLVWKIKCNVEVFCDDVGVNDSVLKNNINRLEKLLKLVN